MQGETCHETGQARGMAAQTDFDDQRPLGRPDRVDCTVERIGVDGHAMSTTVVAVDADKNLVLEGAERRSVLYLDAADDAQRAALTGLFRARYASILGELMATGRPQFRNDVTVAAEGW